MRTPAETEELARTYFGHATARDPDAIAASWVPGRGATIHGLTELVAPDGYRAWFANVFAAIPDLLFEVEEVVADESRAAVRWRARGTFNGSAPLEGYEPNGAKLDMTGFDLLTFDDDGKLVDNQAYTNSLELARQIGAMPPRGSRAERALAGVFNVKTRIAERLRRRSGQAA
jgi:predicted ester cyclase